MTKTELKADQPTAPGWYWARIFDDSPWIVARVIEIRGRLHAHDPHRDAIHSIPLDDPLWGGVRWYGPIAPTDTANLTQLRIDANNLADMADRLVGHLLDLNIRILEIDDEECTLIGLEASRAISELNAMLAEWRWRSDDRAERSSTNRAGLVLDADSRDGDVRR